MTVKAGHELIRSGPYRFVRHPIYSGILAGLMGTAIGQGSLPSLIGVVIAWATVSIDSLGRQAEMKLSILFSILTGLAVAQTTPPLTVYVANECVIPGPVQVSAKAMAGKILAKVGILVEWRTGRPLTIAGRTILVDVAEETAKDYYPNALALAKPYEGAHVEIFYQRINNAVTPETRPALLAHVLVHEIVHIIQGIKRHSEEGMMKARWDAHDYLIMARKSLQFTDADLSLIRQGMINKKGPQTRLVFFVGS